MRVEMEQRIREACERGMRAIVLRAGDFFGAGRGSWFDLLIAKDISRSRLVYPGPFTAIHAWAYLPDYAATLVRLAERRQSDFAPFESFAFAGHTLTGNQLIATIEDVTGAKFNASR
jgi:nucleoside-diphosphate-sugar epimerase